VRRLGFVVLAVATFAAGACGSDRPAVTNPAKETPAPNRVALGATLPAEGIVVGDDAGVHFVDLAGHVVLTKPGYQIAESWNPGAPVHLTTPDEHTVVLDVSRSALIATDQQAPAESIDALKLAKPSNQQLGHWRYSLRRPDGRVLAQWSGECEVPIAYVIPPGGAPTELTASQSIESFALGWAKDGRAVALLPEGACGGGDPRPGVYLIADNGERAFVVAGATARYWSKG
jgi:hypothetical protein